MRCRGNAVKVQFALKWGNVPSHLAWALFALASAPVGLIMFVVAVILVILGIALLRSGT